MISIENLNNGDCHCMHHPDHVHTALKGNLKYEQFKCTSTMPQHICRLFLMNLEYSERFWWTSHSIWDCRNTLGHWEGGSIAEMITTMHIWYGRKVTRSLIASRSRSQLSESVGFEPWIFQLLDWHTISPLCSSTY